MSSASATSNTLQPSNSDPPPPAGQPVRSLQEDLLRKFSKLQAAEILTGLDLFIQDGAALRRRDAAVQRDLLGESANAGADADMGSQFVLADNITIHDPSKPSQATAPAASTPPTASKLGTLAKVGAIGLGLAGAGLGGAGLTTLLTNKPVPAVAPGPTLTDTNNTLRFDD